MRLGKRLGMGMGMDWARLLNLEILLNLIQTPVQTSRFSKHPGLAKKQKRKEMRKKSKNEAGEEAGDGNGDGLGKIAKPRNFAEPNSNSSADFQV